MRSDFRPPRESAGIIGLVRAGLPALMRARRIVGVTVADTEWCHLEALRDRRAILSANHPTTTDPLIAFWLSHRLGEPFNYLACRELFRGPYGWLIQRIGAYSILRGLPDRESIRTTRRLLAEQDRKVVIFPEGETYEQNDLTIPFQHGPVQIGFWALEDLQKAGRDLCLPVLPIAVKYRCAHDARGAIEASLSGLERALCLTPERNHTLYERLRQAGERILERVEIELRVKAVPDAPVAERVMAAKLRILEEVAREVGVERPAHLPLPEQMRAMFNAVESYAAEFAETPGDYGRRQHSRRLAAARPCLQSLRRLSNFLTVSDGYVAERMTAERFLDLLGRLETEVFGAVRHRVPREAIVRVAPAIDLATDFDAYQRQKRDTVAAVTARVEASVQRLLSELVAVGTPLF